jgi:hypothetical protein
MEGPPWDPIIRLRFPVLVNISFSLVGLLPFVGFFLQFLEFPNGPVLIKIFYALFLKEILLRFLHAGFHGLPTAIFIIFANSLGQRLSIFLYLPRHVPSAWKRRFLR